LDSTLKERVTAELVEQFLLDNPTFFLGREALVDQLTIAHQQQGAVSLVELQLKRQRDQLQTLVDEKKDLLSVVSHNDRTFRHFMDLEKRMLVVHSGEQVISSLEHKARELDLKVVVGVVDHPNTQITVSREHWSRFKSQHIGERGAYLGRLKRSAKERLFGLNSSVFELGSYAVISFEHPNLEGFICFCSEDGGRFQPSQDTLYLSHLAMVTAHQLSSLEWQKVQTLHAQSNA
jgi:uncharacterized protein YigA (DUF484 family)